MSVIDAALSDRPGRLVMQADDPAGARLSATGTIEVRATTLDTLVFEEGLRPPSLLKLDVEGEEVAVLRGARRVLEDHRPIVLLSTHSAALRAECHRLLVDLGYVVEPEDGRTAVADTDEVIATPAGRRPLRGRKELPI